MNTKRASIVFLLASALSGATSSSVEAAEEYYSNGKLKADWSYLEGELAGGSKEYYKNGNLWKTWNYKKGKLEGYGIGFKPKSRVHVFVPV